LSLSLFVPHSLILYVPLFPTLSQSLPSLFHPLGKEFTRWNSFEFEINAAYLIQIGDGTFYNVADIKSRAPGSSEIGAKPEWEGFKVGVAINFILIKPRLDKS
jgi:hypothetical protein